MTTGKPFYIDFLELCTYLTLDISLRGRKLKGLTLVTQEITLTHCYFRPINVGREGPTSSDREVLLLIRRNTDGDFWVNREGWDANVADLNKWFGVTESGNGRVVKLELRPYFIEDEDVLGRLVGEIQQQQPSRKTFEHDLRGKSSPNHPTAHVFLHGSSPVHLDINLQSGRGTKQ